MTNEKISHARVVILDNAIRKHWFNQGLFGLSRGLMASARQKHDSCRTGNGWQAHQQQTDFWIPSVIALGYENGLTN